MTPPLCPYCLTRPLAARTNRERQLSATCCDPACVRAARVSGGKASRECGGGLVSDPAILERPPGRLAARLAEMSREERALCVW